MEYSGEFVHDFIISHHAVFKIAEWFHCQWNMGIGMKSKKLSPTYEERHMYSDDGDFLFKRPGKDKWEIAEVKHKNMHWTDADSFPYDTVFVSNVHSVERGHEPHLWVLVNKSLTHAIIIPKSTKRFWIKETVYNRNSGKEEEKYLCAKHLTQFHKIRTYGVDD
jgi:hypothetical protein